MFLRAVKIITIATISSIITASTAVDDTVLDPSLYLAPSPPLRLTSNSITPEETWSRSYEYKPTERVIRDVMSLPEIKEATTKKQEAAETGRMFWPRFSKPQPLGINIPLSFSLSGTYGKLGVPLGVVPNTYTASNPAVIANTYTSVSNTPTLIGQPIRATSVSGLFGKTTVGAYGRTALAGSSYGSYGLGSNVRIYGGDNVPAWSGWGNGKWGHYGKG